MSVFNWALILSFISDVFTVYSNWSFLSSNEFTLSTIGRKEVLMLYRSKAKPWAFMANVISLGGSETNSFPLGKSVYFIG